MGMAGLNISKIAKEKEKKTEKKKIGFVYLHSQYEFTL